MLRKTLSAFATCLHLSTELDHSADVKSMQTVHSLGRYMCKKQNARFTKKHFQWEMNLRINIVSEKWCWTANDDLPVKPSVFSSWLYTCPKAIALKYECDHCSIYNFLLSVSSKILSELFPQHVKVQLRKPLASLSAWSWLLIARDYFELWSLKERREEEEEKMTTTGLWNQEAILEISKVSWHKLLWALV